MFRSVYIWEPEMGYLESICGKNRVLVTKYVMFDETWYLPEKKETYVSLSKPAQYEESKKPARNETRVHCTRSDELLVSVNPNESGPVDDMPINIEDQTTQKG